MSSIYGYAGKILRVDLTNQTYRIEELRREVCKRFLGGIGFTTKLVLDELKPLIDPLSPDNILAISPGCFVGFNIPTAVRCEASSKSPLTYRFGTSSSGYFWSYSLKRAGYDMLVIYGKSPKPVYLLINDDLIEIKDASHLVGKDCWETVDIIKKENGKVEVACIGPAGENLVRYASIQNGYYNSWGRCGLGAVMGSKNLKAIAVSGSKEIQPYNEKALLECIHELVDRILSFPPFEKWRKYGTMIVTEVYSRMGALPAKNFQYGTIEGWERCTYQELSKYEGFKLPCITCPIACSHVINTSDGRYKAEITSATSFGAKLALLDLKSVIKCAEVCSRYGLDIITTAGTIAWAIECYERGILSKEQVGLDLKWGDEESILELIRKIAFREGFGNILAEGSARASKIIGRGSDRYAIQVKGMEIGGRDPRAKWSVWCFGYITNIRGGDDLRARPPIETFKDIQPLDEYFKEVLNVREERIKSLDMLDDIKKRVFLENGKYMDIVEMTIWSENLITVFNCTGLCIRPPVLGTVGPHLISKIYRALTGIEVPPSNIMEVGERVWNMQKIFNVTEGERRDDYRFPSRFYEEPIKGGPYSGRKLDKEAVDKLLTKYFKLRGWDIRTGKPKLEKLSSLGIDYLYERM